MKRRGFSLVELMVVVAIIAVLVAILVPAFGLARGLARRSACAVNLRQCGSAIAGYVNTYQSYPHFAPTPFVTSAEFREPRPIPRFQMRAAAGFGDPVAPIRAFPKLYAIMEQMGLGAPLETTWGVRAYVHPDGPPAPAWKGGVCPAMNAQKIIDLARQAAKDGAYPQAKIALHLSAIGYAWNVCLRSKYPQYWSDRFNQILPGRIPPRFTPWSVAQHLDTTDWITARLYLPDGTIGAAQAIHPQEIDDTAQVAEAWDSCDPETAPDVDRGSESVQSLLPGAHWGPHSEGANGFAVLNGSRHPASPNVLYADGSVRADATRRLDASAWNCPAGTWGKLRANSWPDWTDATGTLHHIIPRRP